MKTKKVAPAVLALNGAVMLTAAPLLAVEVTGVPGSPGAIRTIEGRSVDLSLRGSLCG